MFMATINFIFSRDPNQDPVTKFLSIAVDTFIFVALFLFVLRL